MGSQKSQTSNPSIVPIESATLDERTEIMSTAPDKITDLLGQRLEFPPLESTPSPTAEYGVVIIEAESASNQTLNALTFDSKELDNLANALEAQLADEKK